MQEIIDVYGEEYLKNILSNYDKLSKVYEEATKISKYLSSTKAIILGPSSASMPKINNIYQVQIILKCIRSVSMTREKTKFLI